MTMSAMSTPAAATRTPEAVGGSIPAASSQPFSSVSATRMKMSPEQPTKRRSDSTSGQPIDEPHSDEQYAVGARGDEPLDGHGETERKQGLSGCEHRRKADQDAEQGADRQGQARSHRSSPSLGLLWPVNRESFDEFYAASLTSRARSVMYRSMVRSACRTLGAVVDGASAASI